MTIEQSEEVIAGGGSDDYLEARHVVLRGTNREIGRAIGNIARSAFDSKPLGPTNPIRAQESRRYIHEHYPIHEQRILGAADAYEIAEEDATLHRPAVPLATAWVLSGVRAAGQDGERRWSR